MHTECVGCPVDAQQVGNFAAERIFGGEAHFETGCECKLDGRRHRFDDLIDVPCRADAWRRTLLVANSNPTPDTPVSIAVRTSSRWHRACVMTGARSPSFTICSGVAARTAVRRRGW